MDGFLSLRQALKIVSSELDSITHSANNRTISDYERQNNMESANLETSLYLSLCFIVVSSHLDDPILSANLSRSESHSVPFAVDLFSLVALLADGTRKHYPVKKVIFFLLDTILKLFYFSSFYYCGKSCFVV